MNNIIKFSLENINAFKVKGQCKESFKNILNNDFTHYIENEFSIIKNDNKVKAGYINKLFNIGGKNIKVLCKFFTYPKNNVWRYILNSRARKVFQNAIILEKESIRTPETYAFFSDNKGLFSCVISEYIADAVDIGSLFLKKNSIIENESFIDSFAELISDFHGKGFIHGDLKWSNILYSESSGFYIIDIDSLKNNKSKTNKGKILKDLLRFARFAYEINAEKWLEESFFPVYRKTLNDQASLNIEYSIIKNKAYKEWQSKGKKSYIN